MRTGLVLEGGGMRGMYSAGVLDTFLREGVCADLIVGVSAGALFGVNYVSGQLGRAIRYNKRFNSDPNYMGLRPLLREGNFISTRYAYEEVPHRLDPFDDEAYRRSDKTFYAVATDVDTGMPEYIHITSVFGQMDVLRASGSLPGVSKPVEIGGRRYLDGGISDSVPYAWMEKQAVDRRIVILTQDRAYVKKPMSPLFTKLYGMRYPAVAKRLARRHADYNASVAALNEAEARGEVFVIRPARPIEVSRTESDPEKLQCTYDLGVADAMRYMDALKAYLQD